MKLYRLAFVTGIALSLAVAVFAALSPGASPIAFAGDDTPTPTVRLRTATPTEAPTEVPTETPVPPTETAVAPTETPVPPTATTAPGGAPGAGVQPPRTGTGGASESDATLWWALGGALGGAALLLGGARMALRRR
jgi:hypothetical protein